MADNNENPEEQTTEQLTGNEENETETNANGESEVKADIKPDDEDEAKDDKSQEEGRLINATEDNESKMFVGGLSWDTETFGLKDYFTKFGEVKDCIIKKDSKTERSRGFGFVLFADASSVQKVLDCPSHYLDGRKIDPKRAQALKKDGKMFVGGIKPDTVDETVKEYFSKFGEIEVYERPVDKATKKKPRGFCFITFKKDGILKKCTAERNQTLDGASIEVKEAQSQDKGQGGMGRGGFMGGRGGGGGGWMGGNFGPGYGYGPSYSYDMGGYDQGYGGGFGFGGPAGYGNYAAGFPGGAYGGGGPGGFGKAPRRGMGGHTNSFKPY